MTDDRRCARPGCSDVIKRGPRARFCSPECQSRRYHTKAEPGTAPRRERAQVPTGVQAAEVFTDGDGGTLTSGPIPVRESPGDEYATWDWLLELHGLSAAHFEVVGDSVNARMWDAAIGNGEVRKFAYYKADFRRRVPRNTADNRRRIEFLKRTRTPRTRATDAPAETFAIVITDPQFGKSDGDGTDGTIGRWERGIVAACELIERHRKAGHNITDALAAYLGDNTEGVAGHYDMQTFTTDRTLTEQIGLTTDMAVYATRLLAEVVPTVLNVGVPGNHGEVRNAGGKAFTRFGDNFDTLGIRQAAKIIAVLPGLQDRVRTVLPHGDDLTVTIRVRDRVHTFLHGHQGRVTAPTAHAKIIQWAKGQAFGMQAAGEAEYVWSGHYHHGSVVEVGRRVFVQGPALDGGSVWYAESAGITSPPGMITGLLNGRAGLAGFTGIEVIPGEVAA